MQLLLEYLMKSFTGGKIFYVYTILNEQKLSLMKNGTLHKTLNELFAHYFFLPSFLFLYLLILSFLWL